MRELLSRAVMMTNAWACLTGAFRNAGWLIMLAAALTCLTSSVPAQVVQHPEKGSQLRAELLDAARPVFVDETGGPIEFVVKRLAIAGEWAFGDVELRRPGGLPIDWTQTKFATAFREDMFTPGTAFFLLRQAHGTWSVAEFVVGPTDVAWDWWRQQYAIPQSLFWE